MNGLYLAGVFFLLLGVLRFFNYAFLPPGLIICLSIVAALTIGSITKKFLYG